MAIKVAVLGGGMAALTAAYELATQKNAAGDNKFEITVYQMGWRLGGKGASGINQARNDRIEEHGLHIWFGAYHDAFRVMRRVYADCPTHWPCSQVSAEPPSDWGKRSVQIAFQPQRYFYLMEQRGGKWLPWELKYPHTTTVPGEIKPAEFSASELLDRVERWLADHFARWFGGIDFRTADDDLTVLFRSDNRNLADGENMLRRLAATPPLAALTQPERNELARRYREEIAEPLSRWMKPVVGGSNLTGDVLSLFGFSEGVFDDLRRAWELFDLGQAIVSGVLKAGIVTDADWDDLNHVDLTEWLTPHVVDKRSLKSSFVTACYDLFFSYRAGDASKPSMEAGSALRAMLLLNTTYDGAIMWRMNAGMGDTIFAPLYNALKQHNVKFRFFHKVTSLTVAPGTPGRVATVELDVQATVNPGLGDYDPLVADHSGKMLCWPERPRFEQLQQGAQLKANWDRNNLESDWSAWPAVAHKTLTAGGAGPDGFDEVLLGIPIGALSRICHPLTQVPNGADLANMFAKVKTVRTQAFQLWLDPSLTDLGSPLRKDLPILSTFDDPIDTYCDMTHLIDHENWTAPKPGHLAYFCGIMKDDPAEPAPGNVQGYWQSQTDLVKAEAVTMLTAAAGVRAPMMSIWPAAYTSGTFDWTVLRSTLAGPARMDEQFFRANIDAGERYVLALPGTSEHRRRADGSGFSNLFLTGDWISNGLYLGCIEGTVRSGLQAAAAIKAKHP